MKTRGKYLAILFSLAICYTGCGEGGGKASPFSKATTPGEQVTVAVNTENVTMVYANSSSSITFPTGVNDEGSATLTSKFFVSETEVTNAVAAEVFQWAYDNEYIVETTDAHNEVNTSGVDFGNQLLINLSSARIGFNDTTKEFEVESSYENHPVVYITWYGAIMLCNWLTEMKDGNMDNLVYSWVDNGAGEGTENDDIWQDDETQKDSTQSGYRLFSSDEWEYAARYIDGSTWTYGDHVSGDQSGACYSDGSMLGGMEVSTVFGNYAVYYENSGDSIAQVKSKTTGGNALGLYDISGNVWEWCFTENGSYRYYRGVSYEYAAYFLRVGSTDQPEASSLGANESIGFRLAKTQ